MTPPDPRFLATAIEAVVRAGDLQMARFGGDVQIDKKGRIDLVTEVDLEVERMLRGLIAQRFPDHDVLGEEFGATGTGASHRWVFDPVDGTSNYAHGLPIFCSTLALEIDGVPVVGAVYDPNRKELFTAERGVGAWMNGMPLKPSNTQSLADAMLVTGFPYNLRERIDELIGLFTVFLSHARGVRRLGSAAIDLCWVACGRFDAFWEHGLKPWDMMAGALIVEQAGGRVSALDGGRWNPMDGRVLASNGDIHAELVAVIQQFYAAHR